MGVATLTCVLATALPMGAEVAEAAAPVDEASDAPEADASGPPPGVEVMRVRGRGIAAITTEIPASVTQFDAATIEALGAQDISDLSRVTPNVNIVQPGTQATFFVRGVGLSDFSSNAAGAVTIFQDDVSINAPAIQTGQIFDVESVDVLRGPQGTGPFRNASAGAIRVRSRRPTGNYTAQLRSTLGRYAADGGKGANHALIQDYEGALEVPILEDVFSSRFAFRFRDTEPWKTNGCGDALPFDQRDPLEGRIQNPNPPPAFIRVGLPAESPTVSQCGERDPAELPRGAISKVPFGLPVDVNDEYNWAARGTFSLRPPESDWEVFLNAHGSRLDQDSTLGQAIGTRSFAGGGPNVRYAGSRGTNGYIERDLQDEFDALCNDLNPQGAPDCANKLATQQIAKKVAADRPLDIRPYRGDYDRVGQTTRDAWGGFLSAEGALFGGVKLFALSSFDTYDRSQETDTDFTSERVFEIVQDDEAWQTYNELHLDGELRSEPLSWSVGGYYLRERLDTDQEIFLLSGADIPNLDTTRNYTQKIDSVAAWGEFAWDFADDFTLEGGVRWNWERKRFDFRKRGGRIIGSDVAARDSETWQTPTGELILTYHLSSNSSLYARYTRGFKAGHFNSLASDIPSDAVFEIEPADEEYNDAWEAGLRGRWLDRRLQLAGAFFYYRYQDYQIFLFSDSANRAEPPVLEILNAEEAENFGIELEATLEPLRGWAPRAFDGLRVSGNFGWLHGEYIDFAVRRKVTLPGLLDPAFVTVDYSGNRLQNAPEYKASGTLEWSLDLGRFGYLIPRYDVNWSDDVFFDPNEGRGSINPLEPDTPGLPEYGVGQKAFFLHNARLAYRTPTGNVEVAAWVRNIEDQVYKTFAFDASQFSSLVINFTGEPRTIGLDLTVSF